MRRSLELLLVHAIGYYLGEPQPGEAPIAAYGRALGYEHREILEVLKAIASGREEPNYNQKRPSPYVAYSRSLTSILMKPKMERMLKRSNACTPVYQNQTRVHGEHCFQIRNKHRPSSA
jgi:hypothetical protein